jgi:hypothetical protein
LAVPLVNGQIVQAGDRVRFLDSTQRVSAGEYARVLEVERHNGNRAHLQLERDGRRVAVTPSAPLHVYEPAPPALPSWHAHENAARGYAERGETPEALAHQRAAGRLHQADDPERAAIERWSQKPDSLIVAQDEEQADRLRALSQRLPQAHEGQGPPRIVTAEQAYQERAASRSAWQETVAAEHRQLVEPQAPQRAIVIVSDHHDHAALTRALSAAGESELVTRPPTGWHAHAVYQHEQRIDAATAARARAEQAREAARQAERASQRPGVEHEAAPEAFGPSARHQGAEHQGAER